MIVNVPCAAAGVPPLTGASRTKPPTSLTETSISCMARAVPLVISIRTLPSEKPLRIPATPKNASFSSASAGRIVMITSAVLATSAGVPRISAPIARSSSAGSRRRWKVVYNLWPEPMTSFGHGETHGSQADKPHFHLISRL